MMRLPRDKAGISATVLKGLNFQLKGKFLLLSDVAVVPLRKERPGAIWTTPPGKG